MNIITSLPQPVTDTSNLLPKTTSRPIPKSLASLPITNQQFLAGIHPAQIISVSGPTKPPHPHSAHTMMMLNRHTANPIVPNYTYSAQPSVTYTSPAEAGTISFPQGRQMYLAPSNLPQGLVRYGVSHSSGQQPQMQRQLQPQLHPQQQQHLQQPPRQQRQQQFFYQPSVSQTPVQYISSGGQYMTQPVLMVPTARAPHQIHPQQSQQPHQHVTASQNPKSNKSSKIMAPTTQVRSQPSLTAQSNDRKLKTMAKPTSSRKSKKSCTSTDEAKVAQNLLALSDHTLSDTSDDTQANPPLSKITGKPKRKYVTKKAKAAAAAAAQLAGKSPSQVADLLELGTKRMRKARLRDTTRRYACKICQKRFVSPSKLRRHMLVHSGVKQFGCRICHSRFGQKSALVVHLKRKHPEMLEVALQQMSQHDDSGSDTKHTALIQSTSGAEEDVVSTQQPPIAEQEEFDNIEEDEDEDEDEDKFE